VGALAQDHWGWSAFALAVVALGVLAAFTGPANMWAVIGIGFFLLLLTRAASQTWDWQGPPWVRAHAH
jgi:hypothetical protein